MKRFVQALAFALSLVLSFSAGPGVLSLSKSVSAQVPGDTAGVSAVLSGTVTGIADHAVLSGVFAIEGTATATGGSVRKIEAYLDGVYAPTIVSGAPSASVGYRSEVDPGMLESGQHRIDIVVFGADGSHRRIGGRWFHVERRTTRTSLEGLSEAEVVTATRTVTARLEETDLPVVSIDLLLDGTLLRTVPVAPATRRPVLSFLLDYSLLIPGRHILTIVSTDMRGVRQVASETVFRVARAAFTGAIDQSADRSLVGASPITGYVLHGHETSAIEATIDGTTVYAGKATLVRNDAAFSDEVRKTRPTGFSFLLDTTAQTDGRHELEVIVRNAAGASSRIEKRTIYIDNRRSGTLVNVTTSANGRSEPSTDSAIVTAIPLGATLDILSEVHGQSREAGDVWYQVKFANGGTSYTCYVYNPYVAIDATARANSISMVSFDAMTPYPDGFHFQDLSYTTVVPNTTDRIKITELYLYPGTSSPVLRVDGTPVSDVRSDLLLSPGGHVVELELPAAGTTPARIYTFRVLRLADQIGTVTASSVKLRSSTTTSSTILRTLQLNESVIVKQKVKGEFVSAYGTDLWYYVRCSNGLGGSIEGYVLSSFIQLQDTDSEMDFYLSLSAFPESYHAALWDLHVRHPLWRFDPLDTGLSWNTVLNEESRAGARRNLTTWYATKTNDHYSMVYPDYSATTTTPPYNAAGFFVYDSPNWVAASRKMVAYYLDPRNFFDDRQIFQFEQLSYDAENHTLAGIEKILAGNYMGSGRTFPYRGTDATGNPVVLTMTYAQAFLEAAKQSGVSPYHLASKSRMEVSTTASHTGTLQAATDTTVTLAVTANPNDDFYNGFTVRITSGKGSGQSRSITDYTGATRTAQVAKWTTTPDATSVYGISGPFIIASALGTLGLGAMDPMNQYYVCKTTPSHTENPVQIPVYITDPADSTKTILDHFDTIYVHYYAGSFNFYNIGAYPDPSVLNGAMKNGVRFAQWGQSADSEDRDSNWSSERSKWMLPWTDPLKAIVGGAKYLATNYIGVGQDTMYLEKFDLIGPSYYNHQFVQNVQAARDEGVAYYNAYLSIDGLEAPFVFRIPVFTDMPDEISPKPVT